MTPPVAEPPPTRVTAITFGIARGYGFARACAARVNVFARRLPVVRLVRIAEILAARIQLGIGGVALTVVAEFVGDLVHARRR